MIGLGAKIGAGIFAAPGPAAEAAGSLLFIGLALLRGAIGFSSFAILTYYALTNAASWTLPADQRRWPRWLAVTGLSGCIVLAVTLPREAVIGGALLLAVGSVVWLLRARR